MSSAPTGSAAPLTPDLLRRFLIDAPSVFKDKLQRGNEKQILSNCYRSLWSNNLDWMQRYFFKEGLTDNESLTQLLERHDLFGAVDNDDTSMNIIQSNPDNVLVDSTQDEPEYWESQRGKQCGHLFKKGESVYRCRNCGLDDTCVMCSRCFHATNHDGHDVKIWISRGAGGCCDCGDPEAWKIPLECRIHSLSATHNDAGVKIVRPTMEPYDTIPTELLNSIHDTIAVVLDYLLETFAASPEDVSPGSIMDVLKDCEESHAALGIRDTSKERRSAYSCVLWNDERHSFEEVNDIVVRATKCSKAAAQKVAENVDAYGRHVILISENLKEAMKVALQINSINLAVTVRSTENTLREEICGLLLEWLKDLVSGRFKFFTSVEGGTSILRDTLCKVLCEEWTLRPDLAALSTRSRRGRRMDVDTDDDFDAQEMDIPDDDEDDGDVDEDEDNGSDDNDDTEYHDADDDIEMHDATTSTALTRLFSEVINDPNNSSVTTTQHSVSSDDNNHPQQITTAASAADTTSTLLEQPGSTRRRHSNTTQQKKQQSDIVDIGYDLDEWLAHTEKLDKFERELAQSLGIPLSSPSKPVSEANKSLKKEFKRKLRLDYLLQFDLRLWKLARASIKDILIGTLISNFDYRPVLGTRFARNYPDLVDAFFFKDREPEHSVSSLSVQLLTVPTVAWMLVKEYKFFGIVSSILSNFFLTDHIHMLLPENYRKMQVDCRSRSITRHRYAYTFFDLRYVLNADLVRVEVSQGPVYLRHFLDVLYQFQAMDPLERQMDTHVEYESSSWVSAFNVTLQVSKLCRLFAGCFSPHLLSSSPTSDKLTTAEAARNLCRSIYRVLHQIGEWDPHKSTEQQSIEGDISAANDGGAQLLIRGVNQQKFQTIKTPYSGTFDVVDYDVAKEPVSFHHPFHWLLSELLEHISLLQADLLADLGWTGGFKQMIQMPSSQLPYDLFLTILDYPLRTIVMLAQINCGVWVRNGYGIRNQARTYRDISVRENTFDRDIYLLQVGFVATNPDHLLVTMLDRFKLWNWFNGKTHKAHPDYEASQLIFIVEEFLNLLAICATERGYASAMSTEDQIRRSIIQYLGISSLAYSELVKLVPESLSENESFETILDTLATYKAPDGLNDHGLYELKDEFYSELDPYFWHFTRNHREEALEALRKHWKKHHPDEKLDDKEEFMVIPQLVNIESGPFTHLGDFLHSATLCQIITHALWNTKVSPNPSDTVLETTLYLAMLAVTTEDRTQTSRDTKGKQRAEAMETSDDIERQSGFIHHAITKEYAITINSIERIHTTLLTVLLKCLDDNDLKHVHKRLHFIVEKIEQQGSDEAKSIIREWRQAFDQAAAVAEANQTASSAQSEYERKKAAAKARQAAIMSQFAQAQSQFMSQHGELYDDEDDDELAAFEDGNDDMTKNDILPETVDGELEVERLCHFPAGTCIVCQEELDRNKLYGVLGLIQNSHILRQTPLKNSNILVDICETAQGKNPAIERTEAIPGQKTDLHGFPSDAHFAGAQVSSCGHLMHAQCFKNYQASVENEVLGSLREIMPTFAPRRRFLCPLCKALGNTLLPVVWKGKTESFPGVMAPHSRYELTGERLDDAIQHYSQQRHQEEPTTQIPGAFHSSSLLSDSAAAIINNHDANLTPDKLESLSELYQQLMKTLEMIRANDKMDSQLLIVDTRKPLMQLFDMYAYTIASIEIGQRGVDESSSKRDLTVEYTGTFLDGISIQTQTLLKILAKTNDLLPKALNINMISENRHSMKRLALSTLRQVMYQDLPFSADGVDKPHITPLLCDDPFSVLTRLGFCVLNDDDCGLEVHHLMRLLLLAEITKTVIALMQGLTGSEQMEDVRVMESLQQVMTSETWNDNTTTATSVRQFAESIMQILEVPSSFVEDFFRQIDPQVLVALIHTFTLPFLRKCLFLMVVHHGFVPQSPNDDLGLDEDIDKKNSTLDEYNHLLSILRLPAFDQLFSLEDFEQQILTTWCQHYRDHSLNMQPINESSSSSAGMVMKGGQTPAYARLVQLNLNLPTPFSMVSLPYRMDQLFDESSRRVCRNCKTIPEDPALCLMCGTFVCARRYCCMTRDRGECNTHMRMCGGEIGIYMVIKECFILFLHDNGGTIMSAPYLDAHGEVDLFLKRGAPQYLNSKRYEQLRQMWLSHSIPAFVRRRMEVSYNYQRWENW
ncbi:uncharacterized protein BX664DRAFT_301151 [Halteromyces radiatus]|uniref:uncharacterized protein n=1 Tax=Halteromyces radiatus TaxID=101107 RepID=UPI002220C216|nr:uncharacterized protein BX664DRAFT_301151 [Halteromyces radiatus]KAI8082748.1 hypothetical protein BX664DRAFT_301151 [Halteromyces radiatus]